MELHICTSACTGTSSSKPQENRDSVCVTRSQLGPHGHVHRSPAQSRTRAPNGSSSCLGDGGRNAGRGARMGDRQGKEPRKEPLGHQAGPPSLSRADPTGAVGLRAPPQSKGTGVCIPKPRLLLAEGCFWGWPSPQAGGCKAHTERASMGRRECFSEQNLPDAASATSGARSTGFRARSVGPRHPWVGGSEAQCVFQATSGCM